jgi:hypothetical protein
MNTQSFDLKGLNTSKNTTNNNTEANLLGQYLINTNYSILPLKADKTPNCGSWTQHQTEPPTQVKVLDYSNSEGFKYFGLITGYNDLEVIDIDLKVIVEQNKRDEFWSNYLQELQDNIEDFDNKFTIAKTINNGYHILYRCKTIQGNQKLAKLENLKEAIIETRGRFGYVVLYAGNDYENIKEISEQDREILFAISKTFNFSKPIENPAIKELKNFSSAGLKPWEDYNQKTSIFDVLASEFTIVKESSKTTTIKRIGAESKSSGYVYKDSGCLYLFSTGTQYPNEKLITPFEVYTIKNHNGNFKEAGAEVYKLGFGDRIESTTKIVDTANDAILENIFPIEVFPKLFKDLVIDLKESLNFPIDYTATAVLTAMATMMGTSAKVRVKGSWYEYPSLFTCLIGNAGANKTHPINKIFEAIRSIDKLNHDNYSLLYKDFERYEKLTKKEKAGIEAPFFPTLTKMVLTNFTPEVLYKRLSENLRGCTVLSDELTTFFENMNNYSKGDQIGVYLSIWSNQPKTIDRIGNPIPLFINKPYLSIIGGLQPRMLASSFPIQKLNNGFFQRFLFAYPDDVKKECINDNESDPGLLQSYHKFIADYIRNTPISETDGQIDSKVYNWTSESKEYFYSWQSLNTDLVNENANNIKGEIISKYDNHFIRLALLLQIMRNPNNNTIELEAVEGADKLCKYFMQSAFKVLEKIQNPKDYFKTMASNKQSFYSSLNTEFTTAEALIQGEIYEISIRSVKEFLTDSLLFKKQKHGSYRKII